MNENDNRTLPFSYRLTDEFLDRLTGASAPSSFLLSLFSRHYGNNEAAQAAFNRYHGDLRDKQPLALQVQLCVDQANEQLVASIDALDEAASAGEASGQSADAVRQFKVPRFLWPKATKPFGFG